MVKGSDDVVESSIATHGPRVRVGAARDETEIDATGDSFKVVSHSRSGRDFVIRGSESDPASWSSRWVPAR